MDKRHCLYCGYELKGRSDQKFCSDNCRNTYHNQLISNESNIVRNINNLLRRNRRILEKLCPGEKSKSTLGEMKNEGYNFKYFTNMYETKKGLSYYFCYDYGYFLLNDEETMIVKRKEYVD